MRVFRQRRTHRKFRLSREGRVFLLVTVGVGFAAVNTANNLLYLLLGLLLSLLLVSGVLSDLALWKLRMRRRLPPRMFAGAKTVIEVEAANQKRWLASVSVEMVDEVEGEETKPAHFVRVPAGATKTSGYSFEPPRRGRLELGQMRVRTRYPFGLIEKGYVTDKPAEIVVYPRLLDHVAAPPVQPVPGDAAPMHRTGRGSEFAGSVRFYREGDEARDIHWKRTASRGELVVREHEQDTSALVTLTIDDVMPAETQDEAGWRDDFERRVSESATLAAVYLGRGVSVQVRASKSESPIVAGGNAPDPIWYFLALLDAERVDATPKPRKPIGRRWAA
jgi:uncharacterized protein (DUF58 family)